ncbi:MAG: prolyl oligopeptidase family protein [Candidatus Sifarchaeia archaeon]
MKREYPKTKTVDVVDEMHGVKIPDPYRWLEGKSDKEVQEWISSQNELTTNRFKEYSGQEKLRDRLTDLFSYDIIMPGTLKIRKIDSGKRLFYLLRQAGMQQPSLYYQDNHEGKRIELVNPSEMSEKGIVALDWYFPSNDGQLVAYGLSEGGNEWSVLHILDVETREIFSERIPRTRMCSIAWLPDNSGFYYTRFPQVGTVPPEEENYNRHVFFHKLGENHEEDVKVFGEEVDSMEFPLLYVNEDCTIMAIESFSMTSADIYVTKVDPQNPTDLRFQGLITNSDTKNTVLLNEKTAYIVTQMDAPNGRIISYDLSSFLEGQSLDEPKIIVPESDGVITPDTFSGIRSAIFSNRIAIIEDRNAASLLKIHDLQTGSLLDTVKFDVPMTIGAISSLSSLNTIYFDSQSFTIPPSIYYYKSSSDRGIFYEPNQKIDPDNFTVKQVWYKSKDGTDVPMYLIYNKELTLSKQTPVLLRGYGGFGISLTPGYGVYFIPWIENGGVFAVANLRGGGEFGQDWHRGGNRENKQNVFDDFISAAEWLIDHKIGSNDTLVVSGTSNGGLLVGASMIQRPDLFRAVFCGMPVLDMVRYTGFEIAKFYIPEYGDPEIAEEFKWLYAYSPYHHVQEDQVYPPIYLVTSEGDSRVDPMHALKMTARLQVTRTKLDKNPVLLWVERDAGHGVDMPIEKWVIFNVHALAFLGHYAGLKFE